MQVLVSSIDYSPYLGRLGIGKITGGSLNINREIVVVMRDGTVRPARITKVFRFEVNQKVAVETACCGEIVAISGMDDVTVGCTHRPAESVPAAADGD